MALIRCCSRLRGLGRNASAGSGRKPRVWRAQGRRVSLPGRYKLVGGGGRGWGRWELGGGRGGGSRSRDDTSLSGEGGGDGEGALDAEYAMSAPGGSAGPFSGSARKGAPRGPRVSPWR